MPCGADVEAWSAAEEALCVDAAGDVYEGVDGGDHECDCDDMLPQRYAGEGAACWED